MLKFISDLLVNWLSHEQPTKTVPMCDFDRIRYEIRPGDVLLIEGRSRVSEAIKQITQSPWSHASLYIGHLHDIDDPILREKLRRATECEENTPLVVESYVGQGTIATPLDEYRKEHIRICRPKGLSRQDAFQVVAYAINKLGTPYAVRQVLDLARFILPWGFMPRRWRSSLFEQNAGEPTRTICSVMIAEAFSSIDFPILPVVKPHDETGVEMYIRNPLLFTPSDFDYSPYFEIIKYPFISFTDSPYRHLPWNRSGLISPDGEAIRDPSEPPPPKVKMKTKLRQRFRLKKGSMLGAEVYGPTQPTQNTIEAQSTSELDTEANAKTGTDDTSDTPTPTQGYKKYQLFGKISIRFPTMNS